MTDWLAQGNSQSVSAARTPSELKIRDFLWMSLTPAVGLRAAPAYQPPARSRCKRWRAVKEGGHDLCTRRRAGDKWISSASRRVFYLRLGRHTNPQGAWGGNNNFDIRGFIYDGPMQIHRTENTARVKLLIVRVLDKGKPSTIRAE
jgi:hypothetical protein